MSEMDPSIARPPLPNAPPDYIRVFADQYTVSDALVARLRPKLWEVAQKTAGLVMDPAQRNAIKEYTETIDWMAFGKPGGPVPRGFVNWEYEGELFATLDERIPYLNRNLGLYVGQAMLSGGWDGINKAVAQEFDSRRPYIEARLKEFISQTPEYQLLSSFDTIETKRRPLTEAERNAEEAKIRGKIRSESNDMMVQRFGLIMPGTAEHYLLRRGMYPLDDAETHGRLNQPEDGLKRAKTYLIGVAQEAMKRHPVFDGYNVKKITHEEPNEDLRATKITVHTREGQVFGDNHTRLLYSDMAALLNDRLYTGAEALRLVVRDFVENAVENVFKGNAHSLSSILRTSVAQAAERAISNWNTSILKWDSDYPFDDLFGIRMAPPLPLKELEQLTDGEHPIEIWKEMFNNEVSFETKEEYLRQKRKTIGRVITYDQTDVRCERLIATTVSTPLGEMTGDENLVMELYDFEGNPMIPGLQLISNQGEKFGFINDPNGDPHAPCDIEVDAEKAVGLADTYDSIGLTELARQIRDYDGALSIDGLVELLRSNSQYIFPEKSSYLNVTNWKDFQVMISEGKIHTQCTGSAQLLKKSFEYIFGEGTAATISGKVLGSNETRINDVGHQQVIFTYEGRQYILDATPSETDGAEVKKRVYGNEIRRAPRVPKIESTPPETVETPQEVESKTVEQQLAELEISLTERLLVAYAVPNEKILKETVLAYQRKEEPARRMYDLLRGIRAGKIDQKHAQEITRSIIRGPELKLEVRRRLRIDHYSQGFLEQLAASAWHLRSILDSRQREG